MEIKSSQHVPDEASLLRCLREHFGLPGFRSGQLEAVTATLAGQDSLIILPTGGGKSVCFQLPCHAREYGFTVVICPLIALAKDQVDKCDERGIYAERWNCEVPEVRKASILKDLVSDEPSLRLLYTTPESLRQPKLLESLKEACANGTLVSFAVDEAHTVSEWGHDFRPAYLELSLIKQEFPSVPVAALTASCTSKVSDDIISVLRLRSPRLVKGSFNRPNICYQVRHKELIGDGSDQAALEDLIRFIQEHPDEGGIIYARLRATCDWLASALAARDVEVGCYHAGKATDARARVQRDWSSGGLNVVVATIAFGMGIDRADVRWVVHWNAPSSMEGFYQESGRAGRDGLPSLSIVYASHADLESNHKMERGTRSGAVVEVAGYAHGAGCRRKHVLKFFGEDRGHCNSSCDQLCDFCTDPRAVQRALSQLEQRSADQSSKAAAVRARMMGIRVVAGDGSSQDEGASPSKAEGSAPKPRAGALWSRATTYGAAAAGAGQEACGAADEDTCVSERPQSCGTGAAEGQRPGAAAGNMPLLTRRPPAIKRALPMASAAADTAAAARSTQIDAADDSCATTASGLVRSAGPAIAATAIESVADGSTAPQGNGEGSASAAGEVTTRQPQLKRPKSTLLLPFKAPARNVPCSSGLGSGAAEAVVLRPVKASGQEQVPPTSAPQQQADGLCLEGVSSAEAGHVGAQVGPGGSSTTGVTVSGRVALPTVPLIVKRRQPFKPPVRVAQV